MMESQPAQHAEKLLGTKRYALFWVSSLLSNIGFWMQQVAQPWVILSLTSSSFWVGLDSFAMNTPGWIFSLWGGVIADRFDRKKVVLICQSIQFLCVLTLLILIATGIIQIWMILFCSVIIGTTDSLSMPAYQAIIPSIIDEKELPRAIALNSTQFNLSRVVGPAIAGFALSIWGPTASYSANLISFIPFFLSLYWIYPRNPLPLPPPTEALSTHFLEYKKILTQPKFLFPLLTIFTSTLFCSPLLTFTPVLVKQIYLGSAINLGHTLAAFGIGGVLGALFNSFINTKYITLKLANWVASIFGATLIIVSFVQSLVGVACILMLAGTAMAITGTTVNSILQKYSKNHFRGRVVSLFQLSMQGGLGLGGLLMGLSSLKIGIEKALFINGLMAIAVQGLIYFRSRSSQRNQSDSYE